VSEDKELTYKICELNNLKIPKTITFNYDENIENIFKAIDSFKFPLVSKPTDQAH
jgi:carbamoylphosphate synthase large subunit